MLVLSATRNHAESIDAALQRYAIRGHLKGTMSDKRRFVVRKEVLTNLGAPPLSLVPIRVEIQRIDQMHLVGLFGETMWQDLYALALKKGMGARLCFSTSTFIEESIEQSKKIDRIGRIVVPNEFIKDYPYLDKDKLLFLACGFFYLVWPKKLDINLLTNFCFHFDL